MNISTVSFVPPKSFFTPLLALLATFALAFTLAASSLAQSAPTSAADASLDATTSTWRQTIGAQHATMLRSRSTDIQEAAMRNVISLAKLRPGEFDLTPAVPALLSIYEFDRNQQRRIMAVAALRAIGDKYGMDELYRLSEKDHRASRVHQFAQHAVKHYYTQEAMEREEARSAYYLAKGDAEKAERHALRAAAYRSKLG